MRIRWKLILSISIPLLLVDGALVYRDFVRLRGDAVADAQSRVIDRARMAAALIESRLLGVMRVAESTADVLSSEGGRRNRQMRGLLGANLRESWVAGTVVAFEPGTRLEEGMPGAMVAARRVGGGPTDGTSEIRGPSGGGGGDVRGRGGRPASTGQTGQSGQSGREARGGPRGDGGPGGPAGLGPSIMGFGDSTSGYVHLGQPWYEWAKRINELAWTSSFQMPGMGSELMYGYVAPIQGDDGEFAGMVMVMVRAVDLKRLVGRGGGQDAGDVVDAATDETGDGSEGSRAADRLRGAGIGRGVDSAERFEEGRAARAIEELGFGSYSIIDGQGRFVFSPDGTMIQSDSMFDSARELGGEAMVDVARRAFAGESGVARTEMLGQIVPGLRENEAHWLAFASIPSTGWVFMTALEESEVMGPVMEWLQVRAGYSLMALALPVLIVTLVSIRMSRPIEELAGAVEQVSGGDLDVRVEGVKSSDEVGKLARGFNVMVERVREQIETIGRESAAREKVDSELRIARKIQTDLLPRTFPPFPERDEFELHACNEPASRMAGDFYDFFFTPEGFLMVVVADVSGKGVPAAMLMAVTRTIVRNEAMRGRTPREIVRHANDLLVADTSDGMFVTMFVAQYEPKTGRLVYVNAGHPLPRVIGTDGGVRAFGEGTAPLVGAVTTQELNVFEQGEGVLGTGEAIVIYTDGVTEARDGDGKMLYEKGLDGWLVEMGNGPVSSICGELMGRVKRMEGGSMGDDVTVVVLKRTA